MKSFLLSFLFLFLTCVFSFSYEETPYFRESEKVGVSFFSDFFYLSNSILSVSSLDIDYSVNDRFLVSFKLPYLFYDFYITDGVIGDVELKLKFLLERDFYEKWRFFFFSTFRFPTGVSKEDSFKYIKGKFYTYYPFSRGAFGFYPGFSFSYLLEPFMFWLNLSYLSDNYRDEEIISFNSGLDRLKLSFNTDFSFLMLRLNDIYLYYQGLISLAYFHNISEDKIFNDFLELYFENSIKIGQIFKFSLGFLYPIFLTNNIYKYSFSLSLSIIF